MSSTQFNKGPSYGLSAEVKNRLLSKYDPQKEAELRSWIEGLTGLSIGPDFQKGLKDGVILCTLMNKLQPGSVPKINRSLQNWHQLENLSTFIKAMVSYGMNPVDLFEANDLFESGNMTQVQVSLLALAGKAKTKGLQSGVDIGVKYSEKQERNFDDATMKAGHCVIGLQMGTNKCASQSGMTAYGTRRHLYDPKNHILPPMDHSTISLQMGTNKCASQILELPGAWGPSAPPGELPGGQGELDPDAAGSQGDALRTEAERRGRPSRAGQAPQSLCPVQGQERTVGTRPPLPRPFAALKRSPPSPDGLHSGRQPEWPGLRLGPADLRPQVLPAGPGGGWGCRGCRRRPRPRGGPGVHPLPAGGGRLLRRPAGASPRQSGRLRGSSVFRLDFLLVCALPAQGLWGRGEGHTGVCLPRFPPQISQQALG